MSKDKVVIKSPEDILEVMEHYQPWARLSSYPVNAIRESILYLAKENKSLREEITKLKSEKEPAK